MSVFNSIDISSSALTAEKTRLDVISKNIANANSKTSGGTPYRRQMAVFQENNSNRPFSSFMGSEMNKFNKAQVEGGVRISKIVEDQSDFKYKYEPGHPDADENGYVQISNVEVVKEMIDLISAQRGYDANITAINSSKSMITKALDIGRR